MDRGSTCNPGGRIWRAGGTVKVWPHAKAAEGYQENADHADFLAHLVGIRKLSQPTNQPTKTTKQANKNPRNFNLKNTLGF